MIIRNIAKKKRKFKQIENISTSFIISVYFGFSNGLYDEPCGEFASKIRIIFYLALF